MTEAPAELDPRSPLVRLANFFDGGEFTAITPIDDSGVLAALGTAGGVHCVAFCTDPTLPRSLVFGIPVVHDCGKVSPVLIAWGVFFFQ